MDVVSAYQTARRAVERARNGGGPTLVAPISYRFSLFVRGRQTVERLTAPHTPVPFSPPLEDAYLPLPAKIVAALRAQLGA